MKRLPLVILCCMLSAPAVAAVPDGDDTTVKPDYYYLTNAEGLDSADVLPQPPGYDSVQFLLDKARYEEGLSLRDTPRGTQAVADMVAGERGLFGPFAEVFGIAITEKDTPEIYKLVSRVRGDLGNMATRTLKKSGFRKRPFDLYGAQSCYPPAEEEMRVNSSYPSAHAARGWGAALILSEINPDNKEAILRRGIEMGQSRVICGFHWQSDVDAGRLLGAGTVAILHSNPVFLEQMVKAKAEFARLKQEGKIK